MSELLAFAPVAILGILFASAIWQIRFEQKQHNATLIREQQWRVTAAEWKAAAEVARAEKTAAQDEAAAWQRAYESQKAATDSFETICESLQGSTQEALAVAAKNLQTAGTWENLYREK